ncbi:MAG: peptide chain release factor N(5)-glutamine methyltransferase, partial [Suipraeoptans sp.]
VQHLTNEQEFMGYSFYVNEKVLIPRQDTETLVLEASHVIKDNDRILDMCTGSGCVLLSLMKHSKDKKNIKGISGTAVDVSPDALEVTRINATRVEENIEIIQSDLFEKVDGKYDIIVSNPPYIKSDEIDTLEDEVRLYDPRIALDGSEDGLEFYRKIVDDAGKYLNPGGFLMVEVGSDQARKVDLIMKDEGFENIYIRRDMSGLDRVVCATIGK